MKQPFHGPVTVLWTGSRRNGIIAVVVPLTSTMVRVTVTRGSVSGPVARSASIAWVRAAAVPVWTQAAVSPWVAAAFAVLDCGPTGWLGPLTGGRNNRVYAWDRPEARFASSCIAPTKRDRATCEYQALTHIAAYGITAPQAARHRYAPLAHRAVETPRQPNPTSSSSSSSASAR